MGKKKDMVKSSLNSKSVETKTNKEGQDKMDIDNFLDQIEVKDAGIHDDADDLIGTVGEETLEAQDQFTINQDKNKGMYLASEKKVVNINLSDVGNDQVIAINVTHNKDDEKEKGLELLRSLTRREHLMKYPGNEDKIEKMLDIAFQTVKERSLEDIQILIDQMNLRIAEQESKQVRYLASEKPKVDPSLIPKSFVFNNSIAYNLQQIVVASSYLQ